MLAMMFVVRFMMFVVRFISGRTTKPFFVVRPSSSALQIFKHGN
jgi:hypothetical protein